MKVVVCTTGASGAIYAQRFLQQLSAMSQAHPNAHEIHWLSSETAKQVWKAELNEDMPTHFPGIRRWALEDFSAPFASGSNAADAVVVLPCSMSSMARIAQGSGTNLLFRSCDVALKERKKLILVPRETPLSYIHLQHMQTLNLAGALLLPACPSFYAGIQTLEQAVDTVLARLFDHIGIPQDLLPRWGSESKQ